MESINVWGETLLSAMTAMWSKVAAFIPNLLAFLLILGLGYLVSRLLASLLKRLFATLKVDQFADSIGIGQSLVRANITAPTSAILAGLIFWLLMLTFLVSATESLGLARVSSTIDSFVLYLPKVLGAVFILMAGLFIAQLVRNVIHTGAAGLGIDYAGPLASSIYMLMLVIIVSLAIGQLELETGILNQVISILLITVGAAAALAFGFGSKSVASHILAGTYVRELYKEGDVIGIGDLSGTIIQITPVKTEIRTESGSSYTIPNNQVMETIIERK